MDLEYQLDKNITVGRVWLKKKENRLFSDIVSTNFYP